MATVLFNKIKLGGANAISISYSSSEIKYVKHGDGTLYYDTQSSTIYDTPSISLSYGSQATAKGGTLSPSLSYSQKWRKVGYSGNTYEQTAYTSGATVSYSISGTGATIDPSTGVVTWASLGTTISDGRTAEVTVTVTKNGKRNTAKYTVRQGANSKTVKSTSGGVVTYGAVTAGTIKNATVSAAGGSGTATAGNGSQPWSKTAVITTYEYTSGSTSQEQTAAATSGTDTISPSVASISATGSNLGTTEKAAATLKQQAVKWSGGGGYSKTGTMYVYQEANEITNTTWTYDGVTVTNHGYANDIPASGGTVYGYGGTGSQKKTPTYTWTSTKTSNGTSVACSVTCGKYSGVYTGSWGTTEADRTYIGDSTATLTGEGGKTAKCSVRVYQEANIVESSEQYGYPDYRGGDVLYGQVYTGNITPASVSDIPASGGIVTFEASDGYQICLVSEEEVRYSYRDLYTSGDYGDVYDGSWETYAPATSSTITVSPDEYSKSITGDNLGTTVTTRTSLGYETFTWSANGESASENTDTVYQEANNITTSIVEDRKCSISASSTTIGAEGGSITLYPEGYYRYQATHDYTSGASETEDWSSWSEVDRGAYEVTGYDDGFSAPDYSTGVIEVSPNDSTSSRSCTYTITYGDTSDSVTITQEGRPAERTFTISFDSDTYDTLSGAMISMVGNNYDYIDSDFTNSEEWYTFTGTPTIIYVDVTNATGSTVKYSVSGAYGCTVSDSYYTCGPTDEGDDNWSFTVTPNGSGDFGFTLNSEIIDVSRTRAVAIDDSTADASVTLDDWSTGSHTWTAKDSDSGEWFTFGVENSHGWNDNIFNWDFVGYPSGTILDSGTEHLGPGEIAEITVSTNSPIGSDTDFNFEVQQD